MQPQWSVRLCGAEEQVRGPGQRGPGVPQQRSRPEHGQWPRAPRRVGGLREGTAISFWCQEACHVCLLGA